MPDVGKILWHDAVQPALPAGDYRVDIATTGAPSTYEATRWLSVESPRYRLEEHELVTIFPMAGSSGAFEAQMPWAALRRRTLPWERRGLLADAASPWLALVLTQPGEATLGAGPLAQVVGATAAAAFGAAPADAVPALLFPNVAAMMELLPREPEARLLAHVREVNQADSELAGGDDDGWMAVVVANRVVGGPGETSWRASLVSLELRDDIAAGAPETAGVIALASWQFTASGTGGFGEVVSQLDRAPFGSVSADPAVLTSGVLLERSDHAGQTARVRYRSPLAPAASAGAEEPDITTLAASEAGRLIAAADGRLLRELVRWRRADAIASARAVTAGFVAQPALRARIATAPALAAVAPLASPLAAAVDALHQIAASPALPRARPANQTGTET